MKSHPSLYERDFYAWTQQQAHVLDHHQAELLDWENLAQELGFMGIREKNEIKSRLVVLLTHLLKWKYQSSKRSVPTFRRLTNNFGCA